MTLALKQLSIDDVHALSVGDILVFEFLRPPLDGSVHAYHLVKIEPVTSPPISNEWYGASESFGPAKIFSLTNKLDSSDHITLIVPDNYAQEQYLFLNDSNDIQDNYPIEKLFTVVEEDT